jgi:hypothetical protein
MKIEIATDMFDRSTQPVMLLTPETHLTYANAAAEKLLPLFLKGRDAWAREIAGVRWDKSDLPRKLDLAAELPESAAWEIWLSEVADSGYALMFCPLLHADPAPAAVAGELALISNAMREDLASFGDRLRQASRGFLPAVRTLCGSSETCLNEASRGFLSRAESRERDSLIAETQRLSMQFLELSKLAELQEAGTMRNQERIAFDALTAQVLANLPAQAGRAAPLDLKISGANLAPVYGNPDWLALALRSYLIRLAAGCPQGTRITLELRQVGDMLVLGAQAAASGAPVAPAADAPAAKPTLDLSLMLAERLLHLLGGEVRASPAGYPNRLESLTIKLPTSHPEETRRIGLCRECPETLQALEYAKELATRI